MPAIKVSWLANRRPHRLEHLSKKRLANELSKLVAQLTRLLIPLRRWRGEFRWIRAGRTLRLDIPCKLQGRRDVVFTDRIHRCSSLWLTAKSSQLIATQ